MIGHPICPDHITASTERINDACILVNIITTSTFPIQVAVKDSMGDLCYVQVDYEFKPYMYTKCDVFGHQTDKCMTHVPQP